MGANRFLVFVYFLLGILPSTPVFAAKPMQPNGVFKHLDAVKDAQERDSEMAAQRQQDGFANQVMALVRNGNITEEEGQALIVRSKHFGCWVTGPVTTIESGVCGYSSASGELGAVTMSAYFSPVHPHTCYLQSFDDEDIYDGGCDDGEMTGIGSQFMMNYECNGVPYSTGWLESPLYDGWCGRGRDITACEIQVRAPSCLED